MTTSGVTVFNPAMTTLIKQAWIKLDLIMEDEEPSDAMYQEGAFSINALIKAWEAIGLHVWTEEEYIQFLQPNQAKYVLGGSTTDHACDADSWVKLTLAQPSALGAATITVNDATGVVSGMNIGVVLSSGATFWTTVNGTPANNIVTLAALLTGPAVAGAFAFAYATTAAAPRVLKIPDARLLTFSSMTETPMTIMSRQEYEWLPQKTGAPGTPTQWFYSPRRDQGFVYVWSVPTNSSWAMRFTGYRSLQDLVNATDTPDFPAEWANALMWNTALELCPGKSVPQETYTRIVERAGFYYDLLTSYDRESEPIRFGMDYWMNQDE